MCKILDKLNKEYRIKDVDNDQYLKRMFRYDSERRHDSIFGSCIHWCSRVLNKLGTNGNRSR